MNEIEIFELRRKIAILVGDNASEDNTQSLCEIAGEDAKSRDINFTHFRNLSNLGFNGNIQAGYLRVTTGWIMFLSDDDVLYHGALDRICTDLLNVQPDVALYNFDQFPYDDQNPLITKNVIFKDKRDFSNLASLFSWQKLTGVILRCRKPEESDDFFRLVLSQAKHYPHIILSVLRYWTGNILYKSSFFIARPDLDHLEHINFLWYTSQSLVKELETCRFTLDINDKSLNEQISILPRVNVIDSSVSHLIYFYAGRAQITPSVKKLLWDHVIRFITFRQISKDGFVLAADSPRFYAKLTLLAFVFPASFILLPISGKKRKLMHEGF